MKDALFSLFWSVAAVVCVVAFFIGGDDRLAGAALVALAFSLLYRIAAEVSQ